MSQHPNSQSDEFEKYHSLEASGCNLKFLNRVWLEVSDLSGGVFLDIGCGTGLFAQTLSRCSGLKAYGTEMSTYAHHIASQRIDCSLVTIIDLPFPDQTFDLVVANNVLMMIDDKVRWLSEIFRVLKVGGKFFTCVPEPKDFEEKPLYAFIPHSLELSTKAYGTTRNILETLRDVGFCTIATERLVLDSMVIDERYINRHFSGYFSNADAPELDAEREEGIGDLRAGVRVLASAGIKAHYEWERTVIIGVRT